MSLSLNQCAKKLGAVSLQGIAPIALRSTLNVTPIKLNRLYNTKAENTQEPPKAEKEATTTTPVEPKKTTPSQPEQPPKTQQESQKTEDNQNDNEPPKEKIGVRLPISLAAAAAVGGYYFYQDYKKKPKIVKVPDTQESLDKFIGKNEASLFINGKKFNRIDVDTVAHNEPTEDAFIASEVGNGFLFGVTDGHGGSQCSKNVAKFLGEYFKDSLKKETEKADKLWFWQKPCRKEVVEKAFKKAFLNLDEDIVNLVFNTVADIKKPESLKLAEQQKVLDLIPSSLTGCSATVVYIENDDAYVASTGCSQAFMTKENRNNWEVVNIAQQHDLKNKKEKSKVEVAHPKEKVIEDNKILGVNKETRSFGDSLLKWNKDQRSLVEKYLSVMDKKYLETLDKKIVSPPYLTAEPEVKQVKIKGNDRFMVISSEEVARQMDQQKIASTIAEYKQQNGKKNSATMVMKKAFNKKVEEDMSLMVIFFNGNEEGKSTLEYKH